MQVNIASNCGASFTVPCGSPRRNFFHRIVGPAVVLAYLNKGWVSPFTLAYFNFNFFFRLPSLSALSLSPPPSPLPLYLPCLCPQPLPASTQPIFSLAMRGVVACFTQTGARDKRVSNTGHTREANISNRVSFTLDLLIMPRIGMVPISSGHSAIRYRIVRYFFLKQVWSSKLFLPYCNVLQ